MKYSSTSPPSLTTLTNPTAWFWATQTGSANVDIKWTLLFSISLLDLSSINSVNAVSEIYIYPESELFLSTFKGQRENLGQSPGNLETGV